MTKRATYIKKFVETLVDFTPNALFIRSNAFAPASNSPEDIARHIQAKDYLEKVERNLQGCLAEILENNEDQAAALMADLGIEWIKPSPPVVPPENP